MLASMKLLFTPSFPCVGKFRSSLALYLENKL